jgi:Do/DeqQ family serine protease
MKQKAIALVLLTILSFCAGLAGAFFYVGRAANNLVTTGYNNNAPVRRAYLQQAMDQTGSPQFIGASEISRPCVVYIKVQSTARQQDNGFGWDPFFDFFGNIGPVSSSGSGVIISPDGYIVTNSHVVENAEKIEVILNNNKRSYTGTIVGRDPSSDLALIKIEAKNLPHITFANSDELPIGEWVLAVGNPFNLTSTVTAGIVSAKGRNLNIVQNQFPIESFIQTDAAINPGNSGGALVNTAGELVGINAAIFSKTGSYSGYGFAIPSNIVKKVVSDIKDFGYVQRAFIEADIIDIDERVLSELKDENVNGVYVRVVVEDGNAEKAGIKAGDLILKVNSHDIDSRAVFDEQLAYHRPGDVVTMTIKRGSEVKDVKVTLTNQRGTTSLEKSKSYHSDYLGADLEEITKLEKEKYGVTNGFRVFNITNGQISKMNLPEGFIITAFNRKTYTNPTELIQAMESANGKIIIDGITPNGTHSTYSFYLY